MDYTEKFSELKAVFDPGKEEIIIPGSDICIRNVGFSSDPDLPFIINSKDFSISENRIFSYPVFTPANRESKKAIILLHGLNERSWVKYLAWAYRLAYDTGSYVILFPISFHINRSPDSWKDPRAMLDAVRERNVSAGNLKMSSFANVALSNRLTEDPLRFFRSGYQTSNDIIKLMLQIRKGEHKVVPAGSSVDIFAYSIGAFLGEIIMMGNPANLFNDSRLFIFCGGSVFSNMQGTSKLIMDSMAFEKVYSYYLNDFEKTIKGKSPFVKFLQTSQIGMAFRSMIDLGRFRSFREGILKKLRDQIYSIALMKDTVIPPKGIVETLNKPGFSRSALAEIIDFPYGYSHENPFPLLGPPFSNLVDRSFDRVFSQAKAFLS